MQKLAFITALLLSLTTIAAEAQMMGSVNWGYMHAQKVIFDDDLSDLTGTGTWTYGDIDVGTQISPSAAVMAGIGGFAVKNSFVVSNGFAVVRGNVDVSNVSLPVYARVFLNDAAQSTRAFLDLGPSANFQSYKIRFSVPGFDEDIDKTKLGALGGLGIVFGKAPWRFVVRSRYHWVAKQGEFDASSFQVTVGGVFGSL